MEFIFNDIKSIEPYREDWNKLAELQENALISYEWFSCCASSLHCDDQLYVVCIIVDDKLIGVAPMYKSISDRHLQIMGSRRLYEPSSLLYKDDATLANLLRACTGIGFPILFSRLVHNEFCKTTLKYTGIRALFLNRLSVSSQFIQLLADFESYEKKLSSRKRYDIRRANKKAEAYGSVSYEFNDKDITNVTQLLQQAYEVENESWKKVYGSAISHNKDLNSFFSCLFVSLEKRNKCVISFLLIDNKPVAMQLAIKQFDRLWILKIGYNDDYASCSPGALLMHEMIRYAHMNKVKLFEFLGGEESWLESWRPVTRQYNNLLLYPLSYKGLLGLFLDISDVITDKIKRAILK